MLNIFIFLTFYFLVIFSTLGIGYFVTSFSKNKIILNNLGYVGLIGILSLIIISYFSNLFVSHNYVFNALILIIGLFFFILQTVRNKNHSINRQLKFVLLIFAILFVGIMMNKTHDDFQYYHFPYIYYLTQSDLHIGIGNFNHGFRTSSSIFYLNSLFYLPFIKYYLFQAGAILIMGFSNLIILKKIEDETIEKKEFNSLCYLSLLIFIFINIFFYRIQEHGTDRSAQILVFIFFIELLSFRISKIIINDIFSKIIIILTLIISLKAFYILYLIFLIPIGVYLLKKKQLNLFNFFYKNFFLYLFTAVIFFITLTSFFNTGCLIYPLSNTCFENLSWSIPLSEVIHMNDWYEQWSKAGAGPNFQIENPEAYIEKFNWVNHWIEYYFFNKVFDFLAGILFISLIFILILFSKKIKKLEKKFFYFDYYIILLILLFEWFYNHPALRYGGYCLIALLIFYPLSNFLVIFNNSKKKLKKTFLFLLFLTVLIFIGRNVDRLMDERIIYNYKPEKNVFYKVGKNHFRIDKQFKKLIDEYKKCLNKINQCEPKEIKVKMFLNKYIFLN